MAANGSYAYSQPPLRALKTGYLLRYKKRLLNKDWRKEFIVLLNDSSLVWFKAGDRKAPAGRLFLRDAPQLIAYGQFTNKVPLKPSKLPHGYSEDQLLVFGEVTRSKKGFVVTVHWFLAERVADTQDWINAIVTTLPPPPPPPYSETDELRGKQKCSAQSSRLSATRSKEKAIQDSSRHNEKSPGRSISSTSTETIPGGPGIRYLCRTNLHVKPVHCARHRHSETQEAAMNVALNTGTSTGWGRGSGWSVQGDPTQILCYYAAAEAALADLGVPDLAFDIPTDLGDMDIGDSFDVGDFGDVAGAIDFGGFF